MLVHRDEASGAGVVVAGAEVDQAGVGVVVFSAVEVAGVGGAVGRGAEGVEAVGVRCAWWRRR